MKAMTRSRQYFCRSDIEKSIISAPYFAPRGHLHDHDQTYCRRYAAQRDTSSRTVGLQCARILSRRIGKDQNRRHRLSSHSSTTLSTASTNYGSDSRMALNGSASISYTHLRAHETR